MLSVLVAEGVLLAAATTKPTLSLLFFLGFNGKERPFKEPPRKLEFDSFKDIGFCKMVDLGEEMVIPTTIFWNCSCFYNKPASLKRVGLVESLTESIVASSVAAAVTRAVLSVSDIPTWTFFLFQFVDNMCVKTHRNEKK